MAAPSDGRRLRRGQGERPNRIRTETEPDGVPVALVPYRMYAWKPTSILVSSRLVLKSDIRYPILHEKPTEDYRW